MTLQTVSYDRGRAAFFFADLPRKSYHPGQLDVSSNGGTKVPVAPAAPSRGMASDAVLNCQSKWEWSPMRGAAGSWSNALVGRDEPRGCARAL